MERKGFVVKFDERGNIDNPEWKVLSRDISIGDECIFFSWTELREDASVGRYMVIKNGERHFYREKANLNNLCSEVYVFQLGKIHFDPDMFLSFLSNLEKFRGKVINPLQTIRNNLSKEYLIWAYNKGYNVVPTVELDKSKVLKELKNTEIFSGRFAGRDYVIKPKIFGEGGNGVRKLSSFNSEANFENYKNNYNELIVQPCIESISSKGEKSVVFVGDKYFHPHIKFSGDFLVNDIEGRPPNYYFSQVSKNELDLILPILRNWRDNWSYCRVDLIYDENDRPLISEVEMINPAFNTEWLGGSYELAIFFKENLF